MKKEDIEKANEILNKISFIDKFLKNKDSKKAIKVLNMIQERIIEIDKTKFFGMKETVYISNVFQMPYDYEVES